MGGGDKKATLVEIQAFPRQGEAWAHTPGCCGASWLLRGAFSQLEARSLSGSLYILCCCSPVVSEMKSILTEFPFCFWTSWAEKIFFKSFIELVGSDQYTPEAKCGGGCSTATEPWPNRNVGTKGHWDVARTFSPWTITSFVLLEHFWTYVRIPRGYSRPPFKLSVLKRDRELESWLTG